MREEEDVRSEVLVERNEPQSRDFALLRFKADFPDARGRSHLPRSHLHCPWLYGSLEDVLHRFHKTSKPTTAYLGTLAQKAGMPSSKAILPA